MENTDKKVCGEGCKCGACGNMGGMGCGGYHHGKFHLVKVILKLIIIILIFWCGFKLGAITGAIRAEEYGHGMMMQRGGYGMMNMNGATAPSPTVGQ